VATDYSDPSWQRLQKLNALANRTYRMVQYLGENIGPNDEWPLQLTTDDKEVMKQALMHLNSVADLLDELGFPKIKQRIFP
jgi:hypothetical protein